MNSRNGRLLPRLCALFIFSMALHLAGTWILPLIDRDEVWYAEASREMNQRGDYVVPYFNNHPWLVKPPLFYWTQALSYRIFGDSDFAARFPCALASALTALLIFGFCARLYDRPTAWKAALSFTLCLELVLLGKAGLTDMPAVLFVTLAAWAGWELVGRSGCGGTKTGWWWAFYLALAGAFMTKGPLAVLPVGGLVGYWLWARVPDFFRTMKFGRGFLLSGGLVALWFVPALIRTHGKFYKIFIQQEVVSRSYQAIEGHGASNVLTYIATLPFYFVTVFIFFYPWSFWFPKAFRSLKERRTPEAMYLVSGILVTFVLFSLLRTKLPHYTLPAFPLIACAVAPFIPRQPLARWCAAMAASNLLISFVFFSWAAKYSAPAQLAASPLLKKEMEFAAVDFHEPSVVWNFRRHLSTWQTDLELDEVEGYMKKPGPRLCILPTAMASKIPMNPEWKTAAAQGFNITRGKPVDLTMLVKMR